MPPHITQCSEIRENLQYLGVYSRAYPLTNEFTVLSEEQKVGLNVESS